jgi:hypothetical protein
MPRSAKPAATARRKGRKPGTRRHAGRPAKAGARHTDVHSIVEAVFSRRDPVKKIVELLDSDRPTVSARVMERLLDYAFGRPPQRVETSGPRGGPVRVVVVSHIPRPERTSGEAERAV